MINKFKKSLSAGRQGFTLLETLVAVLLLATAIAGPLTIASKGIQATTIARDQDTAFYLAQDAIEYVRWVRDTNKLAGGNWLTGAGGTGSTIDLTPCVSSNGTSFCKIDSLQNTITSCGLSCTTPIQYDAANNYFSNTSGTPTIFTRSVSITNPVGSSNDEATVLVTVTWVDQVGKSAAVTRSIVVREDLFNWQQ